LLNFKKIIEYSLGGLLLGLSMITSNDVAASDKYYHSCEYSDRQTELTALSCNIFHESRGESMAGKIGVAFVTLNRVESHRFPDSIVKVVYQHRQFSWHTDGLSDKVKDLSAWKDAMHIASWVLGVNDKDYPYVDVTEGSLFYHSTKVNPDWASEENVVVRIDNHLFYKEDVKK